MRKEETEQKVMRIYKKKKKISVTAANRKAKEASTRDCLKHEAHMSTPPQAITDHPVTGILIFSSNAFLIANQFFPQNQISHIFFFLRYNRSNRIYLLFLLFSPAQFHVLLSSMFSHHMTEHTVFGFNYHIF